MTASTKVPGQYPVALNGREYLVDVSKNTFGEFRHEWSHSPAPILRQQQDQSITPSEASLAVDGVWRRSQESWHFGAGQTFRDREESLPFMFRSSKGIDVWTRYQFSLLPDTANKLSTSATNLKIAIAGARIYIADGTALKYTTSLSGTPSWTTVTGTSGNTILSLASDGFTVYIADGSTLYTTNTGTGAASSFNTVDCDIVAYVKGRVMVADNNILYNVTSATVPSALFTHSNSNFAWVGFAEGKSALYAAGYSGDKSLIYRIRVRTDGSALDQPIVAGELPDGEIIRSIGGYLGFIFLGTDKGARFCVPNVSGDLEIGPLIPTSGAVRCFEGQDRYVWFGWSNYDGVSTGLGRTCLTQFTEDGLPAYATDLMVTSTADVLDCATFGSIRVFSVSGLGLYAEDTANKVASGSLRSGDIGFGLPEQKTAMSVDTRSLSLPAGATWAVAIAADSGSFSTVGTQSTTANKGNEYDISSTSGERLELRWTLTRATDTSTGPTITRATLKAIPVFADANAEYIKVPLLVTRRAITPGNVEVGFAPRTERDLIKALKAARTLVNYQDGGDSYTVTVEDYTWLPLEIPNANGDQDGVMELVLRSY